MKKKIILYYKYHYDKNCICSFCVNKTGIINSLERLGYYVSVKQFNCDWNKFDPAQYHFDYAFSYQNKIFGEFMFEADKMPLKVIEFAKTYFDYIICGSEFLYKTWINSEIDEKFLIPASLGLDSKLYINTSCKNNISPDKFKFLSVGAWQHSHWQDRKGFELLIKTFKKLFENNNDVMLIIKTNKTAPTSVDCKNIVIIREDWSNEALINLYKCCALNGAYISLHKGEGFGRCALDALYCGCNIGATGWSGVLDFLKPTNSTLFPYKFIPSTLYSSSVYANNLQANVAQVDIESVENWMLSAVKNDIQLNSFKSFKKFDWYTVTKNLMSYVERRI